MREITLTLPALHSAQSAVKRQAKRFNTLNCGRRFGKTTLSVELAADTLLVGAPVAYVTPTYKMLEDVWRGLCNTLAPVTANRNEQQHRLEIITGGVLDCWSAENLDAMRGRKYSRVLMDEAAMVRGLVDGWNAVVRPTLIDLKGDAWFTSTPKGKNGFYQLHLLGRDPANAEWKSWTHNSYANPHIDPAELDAMRQTMTERDYRQEILAEFIEDEGTVFRGLDAACRAPIATADEHAGHTLVAGADWGKQNDFTALSVGCADCKREVFLDRFNQIDYAFQVMRVTAAHDRWKIARWIVELNSIGQPIFEQLVRNGLPVSGFTTTVQSKMALIEGLSLALEQNSIMLLDDLAARAELEAYERKVTATGLSTYSAPEGMHDDTVIARALMYKAMQEAPRKRVAQPNPWNKLTRV